MDILTDLSNIHNLETFCEKIFKGYMELLDESIMMKNYFNDHLLCLDILNNTDVRKILTSFFSNDHDNYDLIAVSQPMANETIFISAISFLQLYVIPNFIYHIDRNKYKSYDDCMLFVEDFFDLEDEKFNKIDYSLEIEGQTICPNNVQTPELLQLSRIIFEYLKKKKFSVFFIKSIEYFHFLIWAMRCAFIHQVSLSGVTETLYNEIRDYAAQILLCSSKKKLQIENSLKMNLFTEIANIFIWFGDHENSQKFFSMAQQYSNIQFELIGSLGLRTRFQTKPVSQLTINVKRLTEENFTESEEKIRIDMPNNVQSDDNTLLQEVKFISDSHLEQTEIKLTLNEQVLMITSVKFAQRFDPADDDLLKEQLLTYIYFLLKRSDNWVMQFQLLEMRSHFESTDHRRVQRSLKQFEALLDSIRSPSGNLKNQVSQRIKYFYSILPNPLWKIEKNYADLLYSLGMFKSALELYSRNKQWTEMIECYRKIGLLEQAEKIIRNELEKNPNQPKLLCSLGEITGEIKYFENAWKISNFGYPLAPKLIGLHYYKIKDFDKALEYFWESVKVNSMQTDVWSKMGFIGLIKEDWDLSVKSYRKVLQFENDSFVAWNNLSKAYIKLGDKQRAMKTLKEALKYNFENWRVWYNYILVCADLKEINEMIYAWHRLIDIKGKYLDDELAYVLVQSVQNDEQMMSKALELFARMTISSPGTAKTWYFYVRLLIMANREHDQPKIEQYLQKSLRQILTTDWEKNVDQIIEVLEHYQDVAKDIFLMNEKHSDTIKNVLNSFKLSLDSILKQINKNKPDLAIVDQNKKDVLESELENAKQLYDRIISIL